MQLAAVVLGDVGGWNAGDLGHDVLDLPLGDGFLALGGREDTLGGACLVDHVNRLVGQVTVVDVLRAQLGRCLQGGQGVLDVVVLFKAGLQALEDVDGLLDGGLDHVHFLETTRQRGVLLEDTAVLGEGGGANALHGARAERGLQEVGRIERAARRCSRANQRVNFVDEQDGVGAIFERFEHPLQALLEVAPVFGAR